MKLTDTVIDTAIATTKPYKMPDGGGMYILVMPNGSKYFRLDFRLNGKRQTLALGVYPTTTLDNARSLRDTAKRQIKDGIKPKINDGMEPSVSIEKPGSDVPKKMSFAEEGERDRKLADKLGREAAIRAFSRPGVNHSQIPSADENQAKIDANFKASTANLLKLFSNSPDSQAKDGISATTDTVNKTVHAQTDTVSSLEIKLEEQIKKNEDLQSKLATFLLFSKLTKDQQNSLFTVDNPVLTKLKELAEKRVIDLSEVSTDELLKEIARRTGQ